MKDAYYFSHDSNARQDIKIQALRSVYGLKGYGQYWVIIEMMREYKDYILPLQKFTFLALAREFDCTAEEAKKFVEDCIYEFGLFICDDFNFWSDSLVNRMIKYNEKRQMQIEKGRKGGLSKKEQQEQPQEALEQNYSVEVKPIKQKPIRTKNATIAHDAEESEEVIFLTDLLISEIKKNNPQAKTPANISNWQNDIRLLLADGYTFTQIDSMIRWAQSDDFWKSNILSAKKLRDKSSTLILQMQRRQKEKPKQESPSEMYERLLKYVNGEDEVEQERNINVFDVDSVVL